MIELRIYLPYLGRQSSVYYIHSFNKNGMGCYFYFSPVRMFQRHHHHPFQQSSSQSSSSSPSASPPQHLFSNSSRASSPTFSVFSGPSSFSDAPALLLPLCVFERRFCGLGFLLLCDFDDDDDDDDYCWNSLGGLLVPLENEKKTGRRLRLLVLAGNFVIVLWIRMLRIARRNRRRSRRMRMRRNGWRRRC